MAAQVSRTSTPSPKELLARAIPKGLRVNPPLQIVPVVQSAGAGIEVQLQGGIPLNLPILAVIARLRYRATVTTAAIAVNADGPLGLITGCRVTGSHKRAGEQTKINASAPDLDALHRQTFGGVGFSAGAQATLGTATGNYDIDVRFPLDLAFVEAVAQKHWELAITGLLNGPDYTALNAFFTFGGFADLYNGGVGTVTGYGGAGVPTVSLEVLQVRLGKLANYRPFFTERISTTLAASVIANGGVDLQIYPQLKVGSAFSQASLSLKQFIAGAGTSNAVTLLDGNALAITRFRIKVGSQAYVESTPGAAQFWSGYYNTPQSSRVLGYSLLDWANGNPDACFPTYNFANNGQTLNLFGDITATANAQLGWIDTGVSLPQ